MSVYVKLATQLTGAPVMLYGLLSLVWLVWLSCSESGASLRTREAYGSISAAANTSSRCRDCRTMTGKEVRAVGHTERPKREHNSFNTYNGALSRRNRC